MKHGFIILFSLGISLCAFSQAINESAFFTEIDSLVSGLKSTGKDTNRVFILTQLCNRLKFYKPDLAIYYGYKALALSKQLNFPAGETEVVDYLLLSYMYLGDDLKALKLVLYGIKVAEKHDLKFINARLVSGLGNIYYNLGKFDEALFQFKKAERIFKIVDNCEFNGLILRNLAKTYAALNRMDTAMLLGLRAAAKIKTCEKKWPLYTTLVILGNIAAKQGDKAKALFFYNESLLNQQGQLQSTFESFKAMSALYDQNGQLDSSFQSAKMAFDIANKNNIKQEQISAAKLLSTVYKKKQDSKQSLYYLSLANSYEDSLKKMLNDNAMTSILELDQLTQDYEVQIATETYQNKVKQQAFILGILAVSIIGLLLYRNYYLKKKDNEQLASTLAKLQSTQAQLIQSEKLASLGELTAGIAHEIQNPLNFVNNFAEVSTEMLGEMKAEIKTGNTSEAIAIADDLELNLSKINHHGQRASSIVKGMLEHSRQSRDVACNVSTDINALADEYLRLAYHGWRAKDSGFNCQIETHFEPDLPKVEVIPQDIGRVLLNLINNAFYAVNQRAIAATNVETRHALSLQRQPQNQPSPEYQPIVTITTQKTVNQIIIKIQDNGNGIPQAIRDKIFQPFFTTKPTGQGTGLGLSLAYDIVTKGHGGSLKVETNEGEGSTFIVELLM